MFTLVKRIRRSSAKSVNVNVNYKLNIGSLKLQKIKDDRLAYKNEFHNVQ